MPGQSDMPRLYSKAVNAASVGAAADTFDNVGTIELRSDARMVLGFWVSAALATSTAAEAVHAQMKVSSDDLGRGAQIASIPPYGGGAPGTNVDFRAHQAKFVPFVVPAKGKENIIIDMSTHTPDGTGALSAVVSCVYAAGGQAIGSGHDALRRFPLMAPIAGGFDSEALAAVTTVAESTVTNLNIPAWAKEIVGFQQYMVPDLMTAGEEIVGFMRYRSSMPDFEPQEWPFGVAFSAPLGTPVGKGAVAQAIEEMGTLFPSTGKNESVTPNSVLNVAITTGNPVAATVYYR